MDTRVQNPSYMDGSSIQIEDSIGDADDLVFHETNIDKGSI